MPSPNSGQTPLKPLTAAGCRVEARKVAGAGTLTMCSVQITSPQGRWKPRGVRHKLKGTGTVNSGGERLNLASPRGVEHFDVRVTLAAEMPPSPNAKPRW